jgi:hypothetical protein
MENLETEGPLSARSGRWPSKKNPAEAGFSVGLTKKR